MESLGGTSQSSTFSQILHRTQQNLNKINQRYGSGSGGGGGSLPMASTSSTLAISSGNATQSLSSAAAPSSQRFSSMGKLGVRLGEDRLGRPALPYSSDNNQNMTNNTLLDNSFGYNNNNNNNNVMPSSNKMVSLDEQTLISILDRLTKLESQNQNRSDTSSNTTGFNRILTLEQGQSQLEKILEGFQLDQRDHQRQLQHLSHQIQVIQQMVDTQRSRGEEASVNHIKLSSWIEEIEKWRNHHEKVLLSCQRDLVSVTNQVSVTSSSTNSQLYATKFDLENLKEKVLIFANQSVNTIWSAQSDRLESQFQAMRKELAALKLAQGVCVQEEMAKITQDYLGGKAEQDEFEHSKDDSVQETEQQSKTKQLAYESVAKALNNAIGAPLPSEALLQGTVAKEVLNLQGRLEDRFDRLFQTALAQEVTTLKSSLQKDLYDQLLVLCMDANDNNILPLFPSDTSGKPEDITLEERKKDFMDRLAKGKHKLQVLERDLHNQYNFLHSDVQTLQETIHRNDSNLQAQLAVLKNQVENAFLTTAEQKQLFEDKRLSLAQEMANLEMKCKDFIDVNRQEMIEKLHDQQSVALDQLRVVEKRISLQEHLSSDCLTALRDHMKIMDEKIQRHPTFISLKEQIDEINLMMKETKVLKEDVQALQHGLARQQATAASLSDHLVLREKVYHLDLLTQPITSHSESLLHLNQESTSLRREMDILIKKLEEMRGLADSHHELETQVLHWQALQERLQDNQQENRKQLQTLREGWEKDVKALRDLTGSMANRLQVSEQKVVMSQRTAEAEHKQVYQRLEHLQQQYQPLLMLLISQQQQQQQQQQQKQPTPTPLSQLQPQAQSQSKSFEQHLTEPSLSLSARSDMEIPPSDSSLKQSSESFFETSLRKTDSLGTSAIVREATPAQKLQPNAISAINVREEEDEFAEEASEHNEIESFHDEQSFSHESTEQRGSLPPEQEKRESRSSTLSDHEEDARDHSIESRHEDANDDHHSDNEDDNDHHSVKSDVSSDSSSDDDEDDDDYPSPTPKSANFANTVPSSTINHSDIQSISSEVSDQFALATPQREGRMSEDTQQGDKDVHGEEEDEFSIDEGEIDRISAIKVDAMSSVEHHEDDLVQSRDQKSSSSSSRADARSFVEGNSWDETNNSSILASSFVASQRSASPSNPVSVVQEVQSFHEDEDDDDDDDKVGRDSSSPPPPSSTTVSHAPLSNAPISSAPTDISIGSDRSASNRRPYDNPDLSDFSDWDASTSSSRPPDSSRHDPPTAIDITHKDTSNTNISREANDAAGGRADTSSSEFSSSMTSSSISSLAKPAAPSPAPVTSIPIPTPVSSSSASIPVPVSIASAESSSAAISSAGGHQLSMRERLRLRQEALRQQRLHGQSTASTEASNASVASFETPSVNVSGTDSSVSIAPVARPGSTIDRSGIASVGANDSSSAAGGDEVQPFSDFEDD
eukprot:gene1260-1374_t